MSGADWSPAGRKKKAAKNSSTLSRLCESHKKQSQRGRKRTKQNKKISHVSPTCGFWTGSPWPHSVHAALRLVKNHHVCLSASRCVGQTSRGEGRRVTSKRRRPHGWEESPREKCSRPRGGVRALEARGRKLTRHGARNVSLLSLKWYKLNFSLK